MTANSFIIQIFFQSSSDWLRCITETSSLSYYNIISQLWTWPIPIWSPSPCLQRSRFRFNLSPWPPIRGVWPCMTSKLSPSASHSDWLAPLQTVSLFIQCVITISWLHNKMPPPPLPTTTTTPPSIDSHYGQSYISTTCNPSPSVRPHMRGPAIRTDPNARWWGGSKLNTITRLSELSKQANGRSPVVAVWPCWLRLHYIALFTAYLNPNESLTLRGSWDRSNLNSGFRPPSVLTASFSRIVLTNELLLWMEKQGRFVMVMNEIAESNHLQAVEEDCEEGAAIMAPTKDIRKDACFWWTISTLKEKQRATLESFSGSFTDKWQWEEFL